MNIQHSSKSDMWYTPIDIVSRVHRVLDWIGLDPASDLRANVRIGADNIITAEQDGLKTPWVGGNVFINPPGGKIKNQSKTALFWKKLMEYREIGSLGHAIFLAFSLEALQTTQDKGVMSIAQFPFCVPKSRIKFDLPDGSTSTAPPHSNMIVYVPGIKVVPRTDLFYSVFSDLGSILNTKRHP